MRLLALPFLLLAGACMGASMYPADGSVRPATDVPERFVLEGAEDAASIPGSGCRSPLVDPRDGTRLTMVYAEGSRIADYAAPEGRYGVGPRELLRVECRSGRVVGIVPGRG